MASESRRPVGGRGSLPSRHRLFTIDGIFEGGMDHTRLVGLGTLAIEAVATLFDAAQLQGRLYFVHDTSRMPWGLGVEVGDAVFKQVTLFKTQASCPLEPDEVRAQIIDTAYRAIRDLIAARQRVALGKLIDVSRELKARGYRPISALRGLLGTQKTRSVRLQLPTGELVLSLQDGRSRTLTEAREINFKVKYLGADHLLVKLSADDERQFGLRAGRSIRLYVSPEHFRPQVMAALHKACLAGRPFTGITVRAAIRRQSGTTAHLELEPGVMLAAVAG